MFIDIYVTATHSCDEDARADLLKAAELDEQMWFTGVALWNYISVEQVFAVHVDEVVPAKDCGLLVRDRGMAAIVTFDNRKTRKKYELSATYRVISQTKSNRKDLMIGEQIIVLDDVLVDEMSSLADKAISWRSGVTMRATATEVADI